MGIADSKIGRQRLNSVKSIFVRLLLHVRTRCFAQVRMSNGSILDIDSSKRAFLRLIDSQKASFNRELREVGISFSDVPPYNYIKNVEHLVLRRPFIIRSTRRRRPIATNRIANEISTNPTCLLTMTFIFKCSDGRVKKE